MVSPNMKDIRPYMFNGQKIYELDQLALALADNWEEAKKHLYRGFISKHLLQFGQDLTSMAMDIKEGERDHDIGLFKLIYLISPTAPLCWKGDIFRSFGKLIQLMEMSLPDKDERCFTLLS